MITPVIVLGNGGHAKVLIDTLCMMAVPILGVTVPNPDETGEIFYGAHVIGNDDAVLTYPLDKVLLVNGLGSVKAAEKRKVLFENFKKNGYSFASVIHPSAIISHEAVLSEGVQIMAGAIIQPGSNIGKNTILNTGASIDHDCVIGDNVHLAPGVTLSGKVSVGENSHIGTGAVVIQGIRIGRSVTVAAGAVVIKDVADNALVMGVPAREYMGGL